MAGTDLDARDPSVEAVGKSPAAGADLDRFVRAHRSSYAAALSEIRSGRKRSHWMWYIFPQIAGLGRSPTAQYYAVRDLEEARAYLADPYLGGHLREISAALLDLDRTNPAEIFPWPDDLKLRSSMTLFHRADGGAETVFRDVLVRYFQGVEDEKTLRLLGLS